MVLIIILYAYLLNERSQRKICILELTHHVYIYLQQTAAAHSHTYRNVPKTPQLIIILFTYKHTQQPEAFVLITHSL